ncbi:MAG: NAD(P)/FAD-dependent oxidoreductase [Alkalispirochaeta sp.]
MDVNTNYDVIVIGGGPAGISAAIEAYNANKGKVLVIERNDSLGGILPQCIHNGFGAINFGEDLPGPHYAHRYETALRELPVDIMLDTMVVDLTPELDIYTMSSYYGYQHYRPRAVVLAMGCRERTRAQIRLPGTRAAGIFTAGTAQRLVNIEGYMPGNEIVVLGSGDIGMIMARRLTIEGAKVLGVMELLPFLTGLRRNYVQCLQDYNIPLHLSTTVNKIYGERRVEGIETIKVDENLDHVPGTEEFIKCDTLVLSVGLIPENELSRKAGVQIDVRTNGPIVDSDMATNVPGIFAAGNVTAIYDLVDYVSKAGEIAGFSAGRYAASQEKNHHEGSRAIRIKPGANVGSIIPQQIFIDDLGDRDVYLSMRPNSLLERMVKVELDADSEPVMSFREQYARPAEMIIRKLKPRDIEKLKATETNELVANIS